MGLDIALVDGGGGVFPFQHQVGFGESLIDVAGCVAHVGRDIAGLVRSLAHVVGPQVFVHQRGAVLHGVADVHHRFQDLVIDLDQGQRRLGHVSVHRRHRGDGMAFKQHFIAGQQVVRSEFKRGVFAAQFLFG